MPVSVVDGAQVREMAEQVIRDHGAEDDPVFLGALFDAGLAWVHWPTGLGGLDAPPAMQDIVDTVLEAAGRRPSWMRNPIGVGMVGPALAVHGSDVQRSRHLRPIFTAEEIWCQLFSEPGAGSDVATLATRAVRDGDEWVVNGQKVWTSGAHQARFGLLIARTNPEVPKHTGITAFILDMHDPGVEVRPLRQMNGNAGFNEVYLTDVHIPDSARVASPGDGWRVAVTTLMNERVSIGGRVEPRGSGVIGMAVRAWEQSPQRDPLRRSQLAVLWAEAEVLRLGNLRAQALRERGTPGPEGSVLKLAGALLAQRVLAFAVDVSGPAGGLISGYAGVPADDDIARSFLAVQASTIAGGTSEIMRNILGERVLGLPPEPRADKDVPWKEIPTGA